MVCHFLTDPPPTPPPTAPMMTSFMYNIYFWRQKRKENRGHKLTLLKMIMDINTRKMVNVGQNQDIEWTFLPMVPRGGTVGLQMNFLSFFSFSFTPLNCWSKDDLCGHHGWVGGGGGGVVWEVVCGVCVCGGGVYVCVWGGVCVCVCVCVCFFFFWGGVGVGG